MLTKYYKEWRRDIFLQHLFRYNTEGEEFLLHKVEED